MTVAAAVAQTLYALSGSTLGPFGTVFPYEDDDDVQVYVDLGAGPALLSPSGYLIADLSPTTQHGGNVTLLSAAMGGNPSWPPGSVLALIRATSRDQPSGLGEDVAFSPSAYEAALDHLERQTQDIWPAFNSCLRGQVDDAWPPLPPAAQRTGKLLGFDPVLGEPALVSTNPTYTVNVATLSFASVAAAAAATIPIGTAFLQVVGYYAAGDSPPATYVPASPGAALGKLRTADGQWWALANGLEGWPEWFGAVPGNSAVDCLPALQACAAQFLRVRLAASQYYISNTWVISRNNQVVVGHSTNHAASIAPYMNEACTEIIVQSATADCILIGSLTQPSGGSSAFVRGVEISNIAANRTLAPHPPASGILGGPAGWRIQFVLDLRMNRTYSNEHYYSYYVAGAIATRLTECGAWRGVAGSPTSNDHWFGYFLDFSNNIGTASGNASLYLNQCSCGFGASCPSSGLYTYGGATDLFISQFESGGVDTGMEFHASSGATAIEDLIVSDCILDNNKINGISIDCAFSPNAEIKITGCYATIFRDNGIGINIGNFVGGNITIANCQLGSSVNNYCMGFQVSANGGQLVTRDNMINSFEKPYVLNGCSHVTCDDVVSFGAGRSGPVWPVVTATGITRCILSPRVTGVANSFSLGVSLDSASTYNEIRCTGIDPSCLTGGAANKLVYNGTQITAAGAFGTNNLAQGVMA